MQLPDKIYIFFFLQKTVLLRARGNHMKAYLCWTAPHQNPHSVPSDHTGLIWTHLLPPPQTGQPLWSTHTPPPLWCRHLARKNRVRSLNFFPFFLSFFAAVCPLSCVASQVNVFRAVRDARWEKKKKTPSEFRSPTKLLQFCLTSSHFVSSCLLSSG